MTSSSRLQMSVAMIILSAIYAVIIAQNSDLASIVTIAYIVILFTFFVIANVWKKP